MRSLFYLFLFTLLGCLPLASGTGLSYSEWIEDSLGISFQFPRAWIKKVERTPQTLTVEFSKHNSIVLRFDNQIRSSEWDVDRFIEETLDLFLITYPDLQIVREIQLPDGYQGFDRAHFLVAHYKENGEWITNRFLFANKGNQYFISQVKAIRKFYKQYQRESDLFMKSLRINDITMERWRNDSLNYVDHSSNEATVRYIRDSLRPRFRDSENLRSRMEFRPSITTPDRLNTPSSSGESRRYIRDIEPGRNPEKTGISPVTDEENPPE